MRGFGAFWAKQHGNSRLWAIVVWVVLGCLLAGNLLIQAEAPHFRYDAYFGFWPAFGLVAGLVMILALKKFIQPLIARKEDYYGDT